MTIRSSMSRQSSRRCSRFRTLYQYWSYDELIECQSRVLTKLMSGLRFLCFLVAAAMSFIPRTFCSFLRNSGVSSSASVIVACYGGHYPLSYDMMACL